MVDYESSDLAEREKMALRYTDMVKFNPQGVTAEFIASLKHHFSDAEICEIGYILLAYGGAHNFLSSIGEDVVDENGVSLTDPQGDFGRGGFPLVFNTHHGKTELQPEAFAPLDAPLPPTPYLTDAPPPARAPERTRLAERVSP